MVIIINGVEIEAPSVYIETSIGISLEVNDVSIIASDQCTGDFNTVMLDELV